MTPLNPNAPMKELEKLWLRATARYEVLKDADPLLSDAEWDRLTLVLAKRWGELSPVFRGGVPFSCLASSTGSGIDWTKGAPAAILKMEQEAPAESFDSAQF